MRQWHADGTATITLDLSREDAELVMAAVEHVQAGLPEVKGRSMFASAADAVVQMARDALAGNTGAGAAGEQYQVVVPNRRFGTAVREANCACTWMSRH